MVNTRSDLHLCGHNVRNERVLSKVLMVVTCSCYGSLQSRIRITTTVTTSNQNHVLNPRPNKVEFPSICTHIFMVTSKRVQKLFQKRIFDVFLTWTNLDMDWAKTMNYTIFPAQNFMANSMVTYIVVIRWLFVLNCLPHFSHFLPHMWQPNPMVHAVKWNCQKLA